MRTPGYDLIGDVHGHYAKLVNLLETLGYERREGETHGWFHPEGRRVIFLGDYIDRGPAVREVLLAVRSMVEAGDALAIIGNHEYNALCWHTPDGNGGWLRERRTDRDAGLHETLRQFQGRKEEWNEWLDWFRALPLFLEIDGLRAVHACWDGPAIELLRNKTFEDEDFLRRTTIQGTPEYRAVENVLKGPEMALPNGETYPDKDGVQRTHFRARWWDLPKEPTPICELTLPEPLEILHTAPVHEIEKLPEYGPDELPVFFGHYWRPSHAPKTPYRHNIACLDYSAAHGEHPLVAYRWEGERRLSTKKFILAKAEEACA